VVVTAREGLPAVPSARSPSSQPRAEKGSIGSSGRLFTSLLPFSTFQKGILLAEKVTYGGTGQIKIINGCIWQSIEGAADG